MHARIRWRVVTCWVALAAAMAPGLGMAANAVRTVCTVTVNSADEKESFRRHLPAAKYRFVELVERGRSDWLDAACRAGVRCDVLVISGHYDGGNEFFSDQLDVHEYLPIAEMERVSCSRSCPGLFDALKEVYLFGCNTLNPRAQSSASAELVRSLVREGHTRKQAATQLRELSEAQGESGRDRMRQLFEGVPSIYGFESMAPLGPVAADALERFFRRGGAREIGQGRRSPALIAAFARHQLAWAPGLAGDDRLAAGRRDICQFADDRPSAADKLAFVHHLLQGPMAAVRGYLDRIERFTKSLDGQAWTTPAMLDVREAIARDDETRARFLAFTRDADRSSVRVRMLDLAQDFGWLTPTQQRAELSAMFDGWQDGRALGTTEVEIACRLNSADDLDRPFTPRTAPAAARQKAVLAVQACLGDAPARDRLLASLATLGAADVPAVQAYLRHRPVSDPAELRTLVEGLARLPSATQQVRALELLVRQRVSDRATLDTLAQWYAQTRSGEVQAAIAGLLIRADLRSLDRAQLAELLRESRRAQPSGMHIIDVLIRNLQEPMGAH